MFRRTGLYQCKACGGILDADERRAHLGAEHGPGAEAWTPRQVNAGFTRFDPMDPSRADNWNYSDEDIGRVIPGLETPGEENNDEAKGSRQRRV